MMIASKHGYQLHQHLIPFQIVANNVDCDIDTRKMKKGCQHKVQPYIFYVNIFSLIQETLLNTNIPVSGVPGGRGVHGGHSQPTD